MNKNHVFKIGDVVVLKTKSYEQRNPKITRHIFKSTGKETTIDTSFIPPTMVIIKLLNGKDDSLKKVKCTWYCHKVMKFREGDFLEDALEIASKKLTDKYAISQDTGFSYLLILLTLAIGLLSSNRMRM
ncbi:MAG: hypothetical protein ACPGVB_06770 [Chitinophagales bacterium]